MKPGIWLSMVLTASLLWLVCWPVGAAPNITLTGGSWYLTLDDSDLVGVAGSDLIDHYRSRKHDPVTTVIDVTGTTGAWTVNVRRTGALPAGFVLNVKRQDSGDGPGTITSGTTYMPITGSDTLFFQCGSGDCTGIDIQYRLTNVTISGGLTTGTYSTTITYTVSDAS